MPGHSRTSQTPDKPLLTAWLLLLLRDGEERHGWGLVSTLRAHGVGVEPGRAYRILREIDESGLLSSRWTASINGPRRRAYRLTPDGRNRLAELAATIRATWALHDAFLQAYEQPVDESSAAPIDEPEGLSELSDALGASVPAQPQLTRELLAAWLLLLIARHASYGYGLRRALDESDVHPDPATLYRVLRRLEHTGWLESRWMDPAAGPRRRLYRVTSRGRRNLDDVARVIVAIRDKHATFLGAYDGHVEAQVS
jgi:DNA-binding PadR family transcriptional regulator